MIDWQATAKAAARANAAYQTTPEASKASFTALGDTWIDLYTTDSMQAALSVDPSGETQLSISGTRASDWYVLDVFRDVSLAPKSVKGGTVTEGVDEGIAELWAWVLDTAPADVPISVQGHSLGGSRCHLTPLYLPPERIGALHSFEAPRFAAADFYQTYAAELAGMVCVLNGADLWAGWCWFDERYGRPPVDHIWLKDDAGAFAVIKPQDWPGGAKAADHDISRVQSRLEKIATNADLMPAA